jgi:hypothetical protein
VISKRDKKKGISGMRLFRAFLLGGAMMAAALTGCMTPDQVDELMYAHNHQKIVVVISRESENGDGKED